MNGQHADAGRAGTVYWLTGLSGVGKSTLGRALAARLRARGHPVLFLDGDLLREACGDEGFGLDDRRRIAARNGRLCRMLAAQGIDVVIATISLFREVQAWNRAHIPGYREIWLRAPLDVLAARDPKGLYGAALRGERDDVLGVNLTPEWPERAEVVLDNDGSATPEALAERCWAALDGGGWLPGEAR